MIILKHKNNSNLVRRFLIPKHFDLECNEWVEISIDLENNLFTAKKILTAVIDDDWLETNEYAFPSALLTDFLNSQLMDSTLNV